MQDVNRIYSTVALIRKYHYSSGIISPDDIFIKYKTSARLKI